MCGVLLILSSLFPQEFGRIVNHNSASASNGGLLFNGTLQHLKLYSPGLEDNFLGDNPERDITIYLPPGYDNAPNNKYPVVYLLHGFICHDEFWFGEDLSWWSPGLKIDILPVLDNLITGNLITPMIVVSPDSYNTYNGSWYKNSFVSGNWEDFIVQEVVEYVDSNYNSLPSAESRGIAGHSMGGFGAINISMIYPSKFSAAYLLAGAFFNFEETILNGWQNQLIEAYGSENFDSLGRGAQAMVSLAVALAPNISIPLKGEIPINKDGELIDTTWQKWMLHDPVTLLTLFKDSLRSLSAIAMECGTSDFGLNDNRNFSNALTENEIPHSYEEYNGDHMNNLQSRMHDHVLPFFSEYLHHVIPGILVNSETVLESRDTLLVELDIEGMVYLVPIGTLATRDSLEKNAEIASPSSAFQEIQIPLASVPIGEYVVYGLDTTKDAVTVPILITITESSDYEAPKAETDLIRIYPNPTNTLLTVETVSPNQYNIEITSLNGKQILTEEMEGTSHQLDLSSLQKGVYLITIRSKDFVTTRKIIKL